MSTIPSLATPRQAIAAALLAVATLAMPQAAAKRSDDQAPQTSAVRSVYLIPRYANASGAADHTVGFGAAGMVPLVGDWNGFMHSAAP